MPDLLGFQRAFAADLLGDTDAPAAPGLAVYRNTAARGLVEALAASFPTIVELLGEAMFEGVALDFRRDHPPAGPVLSDYGARLPGWLAGQPWTGELPYLADVARLDWLWLQCLIGPDERPQRRCAAQPPRIMLHPAARFAWLSTPAMTIWQAHRGPDGFATLEPEWREEGALFTRGRWQVRAHALDRATYRLLLAVSAGASLADSVARLAAETRVTDPHLLIDQCVARGALILA